MPRKVLLVTIVIAVVVTVGVSIAQAQGTQPPATYVGSEKCKTCHSDIYDQWTQTIHSKMIQDPLKSKDKVILADFTLQSTVITDTKQQFTDKDVVLTMGWRYRQRYIVADPRTGRLVMGRGQWNLPGQGSTDSDNMWQDASAGDDWLKECAGCHTTGFDLAASKKYTAADYKAGKQPPFVELGIGCEVCHGPGSQHIKSPSKDNIPVNKAKAADAQICGACHSRGMSKDDQGQTHQYPLGYTPGGDLRKANWTPITATGLITDANWWADGHAKNYGQEYQEWLSSKHATALDDIKQAGGQDSCVSCHSADALLSGADSAKLADAKYSITCVACHTPHGPASQPADSLLRREMYQECTICHNATAGGNSPVKAGQVVHASMKEMYEGRGALGVDGNPTPHFTTKDGQALCASCHMPGTAKNADMGDTATHNWKIVMPGQAEPGMPSACSACHNNPQSPAPQMPAETLQKIIDDRQKETTDRIAALQERLKALSIENAAWVDSLTQAPVANAPDGFKIAYSDVSFVAADGSKGIHNYPYAQAVLDQADSDLKKLEQPPVAPTATLTPEPPTPTETPIPTLTPSPTPTPEPQIAAGSSWAIWGALTAIVVGVLVVLRNRRPKAS